MLPNYQTGIVTVAHHSLHHHPALASALVKARYSRCVLVSVLFSGWWWWVGGGGGHGRHPVGAYALAEGRAG